jgi:molecular chaperone Hsp33
VLSIETADAKRYQGIVALERPDFSAALENYFMNSEQLPTRLVLASDRRRVIGLLLQKMPLEENATPEQEIDAQRAWDRLQGQAAAIAPDQLLRHDDEALLRRLFPRDDVRMFPTAPVRWQCGCSRARIEQLLRMMGKAEVDATIAEEGSVKVSCEFCGAGYLFDEEDARGLFGGDGEAGGAPGDGVTLH